MGNPRVAVHGISLEFNSRELESPSQPSLRAALAVAELCKGFSHGATSRRCPTTCDWRSSSLGARIEKLEAELARAKKDTSTSGNPPLSNIVKPQKAPPPKGRKKRSRGAQPGHPRHERSRSPPDEIREDWLTHCSNCSMRLERSGDARETTLMLRIPARKEEPSSLTSRVFAGHVHCVGSRRILSFWRAEFKEKIAEFVSLGARPSNCTISTIPSGTLYSESIAPEIEESHDRESLGGLRRGTA